MTVLATDRKSRPAGRDGFVLPAVIFVLAIMSILAVAGLRTANDEQRSSRALRESGAALYAAEAGLNEVWPTCNESLLGGLNPGDSLDFGWHTLPDRAQYRAVIHRVDDAAGAVWGLAAPGGQHVYLLVVESRGAGPWGGQRVLRLVLTPTSIFAPKAIAVGGDFTISGSPTLQGACAEIHVNGSLNVSGDVTTNGGLTASGTVTVTGSIVDSDGNPVVPLPNMDPVEVPQLDPTDYCGEADYVLSGGLVTDVAASTTSPAGIGNDWLWDSATDTYTLDGNASPPGTVCVSGNVVVDGNPGTATAPLSLSILATGSVDFDGNPFVIPDHSQGMLVIAAGDLHLNGNFSSDGHNFDGLLYGGSQCQLTGNFVSAGHLVCRGDPDPVGAVDLVAEHTIDGNPTITFECVLSMIDAILKPLGQHAWSQPM